MEKLEMTGLKTEYKSNKVYRNCHIVAWHPKLIDVIAWILEKEGKVVHTSGYRPHKIHGKDSGVHATDPLRATDIRHYIYYNPERLRDEINESWTYDPNRPHLKVAFLHDTGLGKHFHIQVHDNTVRIKL
jgi:hypothetical protein